MHPPVSKITPPRCSDDESMTANQRWLERTGPALLPPECVVAVQRYDSPDIPLPPVNDPALNRAIEKRRREFSAGRAAAATALSRLDVFDRIVPVGENRNPLWPGGIVGSITHTAGLAMAVVARQEKIIGLGLDLEPAGAVKEELWQSLFTPTEITWLAGKSREQRARWATVIFCAKESFYKLQYPLTGQWVDFHGADVTISIETGEFLLTCLHPVVTEKLDRSRFGGRYATDSRLTLTAIHLKPAEEA